MHNNILCFITVMYNNILMLFHFWNGELVLFWFYKCIVIIIILIILLIITIITAVVVIVVKANEPNLLKECGGHLELTNDWARHLLKSMEWVERKGWTGNVEPSGKSCLKKNLPITMKSHKLYQIMVSHLI